MSERRTYSLFPKTLAQCVEPLTRPVFKAQGLAGSRLISQWPEIVGPGLANRCAPQKLSFPPQKKTDGTLSIAVENGFSTEIQHLQPMILERLASYFGYKAVSRIAISHSFLPVTPPPKHPEKRISLPSEAAHLADDVSDPELKAALQSLARTLAGTA